MQTRTRVPSGQAPHSPPPAPSAPAPSTSPPSASQAAPSQADDRAERGLAAEVRESLLLLGFAVGATVGLTAAAQAVLALLG